MKQSKAEKNQKILASLDRDETGLESLGYGPIEAWNLVECWRQNAETDGNDFVAHVECALCDESDSVASFFRALGFKF